MPQDIWPPRPFGSESHFTQNDNRKEKNYNKKILMEFQLYRIRYTLGICLKMINLYLKPIKTTHIFYQFDMFVN